MPKRPLIKDLLFRKMKQAGSNPAKIARHATEKGHKIGKTTINDILDGGIENPSLEKIEAVAIGLDLAPEQFVAELLGSRADNPGFMGSQFAILSEIYRGLSPSQRAVADVHISGLLLQLRSLENMPKK